MPDNKDLLELYKQHQASQDKYTYFLLAAAGAAIGFAVQKTEGLHLSWWLLPVGLAIVCWGVSFYYGCKHVTWVQTAIYANYHLLQLKAGVHPEQPPHPQLTQAAVAGVSQAITTNVANAQFFGIWQFRMLIAGAIFFIGWRLLEMVHLTYAA
ncbi:MAG TPA: hypothetical protein VI279_02620 [Rhodocyclaceae bacterium]